MVGVPGRSKACHTCKRRKKGCDLQQPSCGQCKKACIPCEGYAKSLTIHRYEYNKGTPASSSDRTHSSSSTDLIKSANFSRTGCELGIEELFWDSYMPNSRLSSLFNHTQRDLGGSISVLRDNIVLNGGVLRTALAAMALATAASKDIAPHWMKQQGTKLHMTALQQMRKALSSSRGNSLELLGAARVFSLHEALYGGDARDQAAQYRSWAIHHSGDLAIITSNPPSFFATGPAHRLFVDGRLNHAQCAIKARKKLVLSDERWMTEPWSRHPKTRKDLLVDILLKIPALYEVIDNMSLPTNHETKLRLRRNLQGEVYCITKTLADWESKYAVTVECAGSDWRSPSRITTEKIANAHVMTLYWASNILVGHVSRIISDEAKVIASDLDDCCRSIIHCVPLFLHPFTGVFRQHLVPFPLMTAARHLASINPSKLQLERNYLLSLCKDSGFAPMRQFMSSLQPQIFGDLNKVDLKLLTSAESIIQ